MAEAPTDPVVEGRGADMTNSRAQGRSSDEVALELMKFIAVTTGYGKGNTGSAGFSGKPTKSSEEYADALMQLFERCRTIVTKEPEK
ncbi:MAG TPA: hypothetical protein VNY30_22670 [Bryobacteraceae bacterium]|jgi:hypothetical protein|nr:hypothetical protein [Bryobacteraceae bacterium]